MKSESPPLETKLKTLIVHLNDGLQLLNLGLQHLILPLQFQDLLFLRPVLNVVLELQRLVPLQLAFFFHFIQPVLQLVNLAGPIYQAEKERERMQDQ